MIVLLITKAQIKGQKADNIKGKKEKKTVK
jgi:hypothetical protein